MTKFLFEVGEFGLIRMIQDLITKEGMKAEGLEAGIGDDAACFSAQPGFDILVTCDSLLDGRHFLSDKMSSIEIGCRAMTVNISDIGAMGGRPLFAVVSLGLKDSIRSEDILEIYRGFLKELNPLRASIVGGNITNSPGSFFIDITLIGEVKRGRLVRRSTARIGDIILVTGYPGEAAAGLNLLMNRSDQETIKENRLVMAYKRPSHRALEAKALADSGLVHAMIDTSDGFLGDLGHICELSHVGAEISRERLPVSDALLVEAEGASVDPSELVLGGSDDYELIFTCSHERVKEVRSVLDEFENVPFTEVGKIVDPSEGIRIINRDGTVENPKLSGWDHFKTR